MDACEFAVISCFRSDYGIMNSLRSERSDVR